MKFDQMVGAKIKSLREGRKMSRMELAKMMGYESDTAIYLIEKGSRGLNAEKLKSVSKIFQVSVAELVAEDVKPENRSIVSALRADKELTEKDLDKITSFIEFIKAEGSKNASGR